MMERSMEQWKKPVETSSYCWEMLCSQGNLYTALSAVALGAVLSIPYGFAIGLIPVVLFVAGDAIVAIFVPNSMNFRHAVDLKYRRLRSDNVRRHLLAQLSSLYPDDTTAWPVYRRMLDRVQSLRAIAAGRGGSLTDSDVERLDDACVDYPAQGRHPPARGNRTRFSYPG